MRYRILAACVVGITLVTGCTTRWKAPDLGGIYNRAAQQHGPTRNPIIVIPGILGSRLRDTESGRIIWGSFVGNYLSPRRARGARLIALPMREGIPLEELRDGVQADEVLDRIRVSLLRMPLEQKAYVHLLRALGAGGYRDESLGLAGAIDYGDQHFTCFQFPYDWRRDNVENAKRLHEFILEKQTYVKAELERRYGIVNPDVKFDIVAHSMGGLLTRYYLRYGAAELPEDGTRPVPTWEGARYVERAIFVGTPNAGSIDALLELVNGANLPWMMPELKPAILGTMPSIYQLLPRSRHGRVVDATAPDKPLDLFDPVLWERMEWGLASPGQDRMLEMLLPDAETPAVRRRIAIDHLRKSLKRAQRFAEALDVRAAPPEGLTLHLMTGDSEPTHAVVAADPATGAIKVIAQAPGDGIVLRSSAVMDERIGGRWSPELVSPIAWNRVIFFFTDHMGMTRDPAFMDNLLYLLLEEPRKRDSLKDNS